MEVDILFHTGVVTLYLSCNVNNNYYLLGLIIMIKSNFLFADLQSDIDCSDFNDDNTSIVPQPFVSNINGDINTGNWKTYEYL